ncbi:hypothetical protein ACFL56_03135 [Candidatus Margulisiibacteriota bacterium]
MKCWQCKGKLTNNDEKHYVFYKEKLITLCKPCFMLGREDIHLSDSEILKWQSQMVINK